VAACVDSFAVTTRLKAQASMNISTTGSGDGIASYSHERAVQMQPEERARVGDRVSFRICDVFLPEPNEVLTSLTAEAQAQGVVLEFSDSGAQPQAYALVRITPHQSVLLPVGALEVVLCR
jgi:hypothetical protein